MSSSTRNSNSSSGGTRAREPSPDVRMFGPYNYLPPEPVYCPPIPNPTPDNGIDPTLTLLTRSQRQRQEIIQRQGQQVHHRRSYDSRPDNGSQSTGSIRGHNYDAERVPPMEPRSHHPPTLTPSRSTTDYGDGGINARLTLLPTSQCRRQEIQIDIIQRQQHRLRRSSDEEVQLEIVRRQRYQLEIHHGSPSSSQPQHNVHQEHHVHSRAAEYTVEHTSNVGSREPTSGPIRSIRSYMEEHNQRAMWIRSRSRAGTPASYRPHND